MIALSYDIETLPTVFSIAINVVNTDEDFYLDCWGQEERPYYKLKELFEQISNKFNHQLMYCSYNGWSFDDIVLNYIEKENPTVFEISMFVQDLINKHEIDKKYKKGWMKSFDLMMLFNTVDRVSLKALAISMNWPIIQDLPWKSDLFVEDNLKNRSDLEFYNKNDAKITSNVYKKLYSEIIQRYNVSVRYGVNVHNSSQSTMGSTLIKDMYCKHTGMNPYEFNQLRTYRYKINMGDVLHEKIKFNNPKLIQLYEELGNKVFTASNSFDLSKKDVEFEKIFLYGNCKYSFAMGGLHSYHKNEPKMLISTKDRWMEDADVKSYYPNSMIMQGIYPEHLGPQFLEVYAPVVYQRMSSKDKIEKYALKISVNAVFGKMGSDKEPYYDRLCLYKTTVNGQMFLLMLIEELEEAGIEVFYANTDGVTAWVTKNNYSEYTRICENWQKSLGFSLEFATIEKALLRDVNNYTMYISKSDDGPHYKQKGDFITDVAFGKKPRQQIVPKAIHEWFYHNKPIEETIYSSENIYDFAISQLIGGDQIAEFHYLDNEEIKIEKLQKNIRFYATKMGKGGKLFKNKEGSLTNMLASSGVEIINNVKDPYIKNYSINYDYYISQANTLKEQFMQQTLF